MTFDLSGIDEVTPDQAVALARELLEFAGNETTIHIAHPVGPAGPAQLLEVTARPIAGAQVWAAREQPTSTRASKALLRAATGLTDHDLDVMDARDLHRVEEKAERFLA